MGHAPEDLTEMLKQWGKKGAASKRWAFHLRIVKDHPDN
jgi:hypothetical protein